MHNKAPAPLTSLAQRPSIPILELYFEVNALKLLYRQGWLRAGISPERCESVAEHSFGVALLGWFLADGYFPEADAAKVMRMALLHDLGEVYVGDLTPQDGVPPEVKHAKERRAVEEMLRKLPRGEAYIALWEEYERGESLEARLVRQVDRLEMGLQACVYELQGTADLSPFFTSAQKAMETPALRALLAQVEQLRPPRPGELEG